MQKRWFWIVATLIILLTVTAYTSAEQSPVETAIYDNDPQHIWNRIHHQFFVRTTDAGKEIGGDTEAENTYRRDIGDPMGERVCPVAGDLLFEPPVRRSRHVGVARRAAAPHALKSTRSGRLHSHDERCVR